MSGYTYTKVVYLWTVILHALPEYNGYNLAGDHSKPVLSVDLVCGVLCHVRPNSKKVLRVRKRVDLSSKSKNVWHTSKYFIEALI